MRYNPDSIFPPYVGYAHAVEVPPGARTLYVSGLNGYEQDGRTMPADFEGQARLVWQHLGAALAAAGMTYDDWCGCASTSSPPRTTRPMWS